MHGKPKSKGLIALFIAMALFLTSCSAADPGPGVVPDISSPDESPPLIEDPPPVGSALTAAGIISLIGQNLVAGAAKSAGSSGFGWVMNMLGLGDPVAQTTIDLLVTINSNIDQLMKSVAAMQQQLNAVDYNTLASPLQPIVSKITGASRLLASLAEADEAERQGIIDELCTRIGGQDGILANQYAIRDAMLGTGMAGGGMIAKWSKVVVGRQRFFNKESSDMQQEIYNYWLNLQAIQEMLIIEYMHYKDYSLSRIQKELDEYNLDMNTQKVQIPWELPSEPYDYSTFVIFPYKTGAYMFDTNVFSKSKLTRDMAIGIINIMNQEQPRYKCQTKPLYGWRLPEAESTGTGIRSTFVELVFQDVPEMKSVYGWALEEGWKGFPSGAGVTGFSFWTAGGAVGGLMPDEGIVYLSHKKSMDIAKISSEHPLLPVRHILPNWERPLWESEFYFYY